MHSCLDPPVSVVLCEMMIRREKKSRALGGAQLGGLYFCEVRIRQGASTRMEVPQLMARWCTTKMHAKLGLRAHCFVSRRRTMLITTCVTSKSCIIGAVSRPNLPRVSMLLQGVVRGRSCTGTNAVLCCYLDMQPQVPRAGLVLASACFQNRATFLPTRRRTTPT